MPDESKPTCATCRFWQNTQTHAMGIRTMSAHGAEYDYHPEGKGQCYRMPPTVPDRFSTSDPASHVFTRRDDWCGEHQPNAPTNHLPTEFKA